MRQAYSYAVSLLAGMLFVTPLGGLSLSRLGIPLNPAILAVLALYILVWGVLVLRNEDHKRGLLVSVLVLTTFGSFIPLSNIFLITPYVELPIGPNLYVVDPPLLILSVIVVSMLDREHLTLAHVLLAISVIWAFVLIVVAPGPQAEVMLWYTVHILRLALVFLVVTHGITEEWITPRTAVDVIILSVIGHAVAATTQLVTGPVEQLNVLGINTRVVATLSLGPFGVIQTGPYIGGLTGGVAFVNLIVLVLPVFVALSFKDRIPTAIAIGGAGWLFMLVQLTAFDAARGAIIVGSCILIVLLGWWLTDVLWLRGKKLGRTIFYSRTHQYRYRVCLVAVLFSAIIQFIQSEVVSPEEPMYFSPNLGQSVASATSIPGFSTANLSIRLHQYVGGLDTFLKYPLTGLGGGNFQYISLNYNTDPPNMIHNMYIGVLAETGIVGTILYFGAISYGVWAMWRTAHSYDDPVFIALVAGIGGFFSLQLFQPQYLFPVSMMAFWVILAIAVGDYCRHRGTLSDRWKTLWCESVILRSLRTSTVASAPEMILLRLEEEFENNSIIRSVQNLYSLLVSEYSDSHINDHMNKSLIYSWYDSLMTGLATARQNSRILSKITK